jgi:hypothetical protein
VKKLVAIKMEELIRDLNSKSLEKISLFQFLTGMENWK